jgi:sugar-specific transcriptional regulator TrmB
MCSKLNIPNSHIYRILEKLLDKGIISYKIVNNVKIFQAVDPESLYALFKEKERQLENEKQSLKKFISNLKKIEIKEHKQNDFKYFEGLNGVRSMFTEFITNCEPNSEICISSAPIAYEKWNAFLLDVFHPIRIKKNINLKIIIPAKIQEHAEQRESMQPIEIKYTDTKMESEFGVAGNKIYFLSYGDKPYALIIKDKNFANTQNKIFEALWKDAKD